MKRNSPFVRSYTEVHSWVGILTGLFLFTAFYAGAITMFKAPLQSWIAPKTVLAAPPPLEKTPELIAKVLHSHPEARHGFSIHLKTDDADPGRISWSKFPARGPGGHGMASGPVYQASLKDGKLQVAEQTPGKTLQFIDVIHQQAGVPLPHEPAMIIVGIICLLYAMALVSGLIIWLPGFVRDVFAMRIGKNAKLMWKDMHVVFGMFSLPFHIIMALTSLIFAFHDVIYPAQNALIYKGELHHIWMNRPHIPRYAPGTPVLATDTLLAKIQTQAPGFSPQRIDYRSMHGAMMATVWGTDPRYGARSPEYGFATVDPYSGKILVSDYLPGHQNGWYATLSSFFTLHFGSFGGTTIRWSYVFLGLIGAFMFYTGNHLWILSKEKKTGETRASRNMARLTVGWMLGTMAAIAVAVLVKKAASMGLIAEFATPATVFWTVLGLCLIWAFLRSAKRARQELIWVASVTTALVPIGALIACF